MTARHVGQPVLPFSSAELNLMARASELLLNATKPVRLSPAELELAERLFERLDAIDSAPGGTWRR